MSGPRPMCGMECGAVEEETMVINGLLHLPNNWAVAQTCCDTSLVISPA